MDLIKNECDRVRALDILEQAFTDVPGVTWMVENRRNKKAALRELLSFCFQESSARHGAYLTSDKNGVVFFYDLTCKPKSLLSFFRKLHLIFTVIGIRRSIEIIKTRRVINGLRPRQGWYGWFLGTAKDVKGIRAAYEIKRDMYKISNETNQPIYVETTVFRNMMLYQKIGFYEYAKIKHPYKKADVWLMKRDPRTSD